MKKPVAVLMAALLLIGTLVWGVSAEGFVFEESARELDNGNLIVTWNYDEVPEESTVEFDDVLIGGTSCAVLSNADGKLTVDVSALPAGVHGSVTYRYMLDAQSKSVTVSDPVLVIPGTVSVTLSLAFDDEGFVTVKATDDNGNPVAGYGLLLSIGDMDGISGTTGSKGTYSSRVMAEYDGKATCTGVETDGGNGVIYAAAAQVSIIRTRPATTTSASATVTTTAVSGGTTTTVTESTSATTDHSVTTSTAVTSGSATTAAGGTISTIKGAGTTSKQDGKIAVNVSLDTNILDLFGLTQADFDNNARMLISEEDYSSLVGRTSYLLMLNMLTSQTVPTEEQIQSAVAASSRFSGYAAEERQAITFDLSFLILNKSTGEEIPVSALPLNSTYTVQLPVPAGMEDCETFAVTVADGDSLVEPVLVQVKNGCFQLEINSLEPYTLIGFGSGGSKAAGSNSVWLIVLLIVGILLLVGAAVLLYLFVLRKPAVREAEQTHEEAEESPLVVMPELFGEDDIFSGRPDISEINRRPPSDLE